MPVKPEAFDAIVIGAGAGGLTVASGLAGFGRRVALIEARRVGGDCTNTGCIPSKRLIHLARHDPAWDDSARLFTDVRATRDRLAARERHELLAHPRIELIEGRASFAWTRTVDVTGAHGRRTLTARHVVVAAGSRPRTIAIPGLPDERLLTNANLFDLDIAPRHLAIVGAGAIGVEMASAFTRLGTRITLIDLEDRVLPQAIPEASAAVLQALKTQGVDVLLRARVAGYEESGRLLIVDTERGVRRIDGVDRVLLATGRIPNVEDLDLAAAEIPVGSEGIPVDSWGRTRARGVWAVGDVTPGSHQTHAANALGRRVVQRIIFPWLPLGRPPVIPSAVFSDPEVAWVSRPPREAPRRRGLAGRTRITVDLADTDRGLTDGIHRGFVAVEATRLTGGIVSATVVGPGASEMIAVFALAMTRRTSLLRLARMSYAYPTFSGAIGAVADEFARRTFERPGAEIRAYVRSRLTGAGACS